MSDLSEKVIALSIGYLGPAVKVFLERQTRSHMNDLQFESLQQEHLPEFSRWVSISAGLIIDKEKAKELADKIMNL